MDNTTEAEKRDFIGKYLDKHMKGHGLDGMAYYNKLSKTEDKAILAWERKQKKLKNHGS